MSRRDIDLAMQLIAERLPGLGRPRRIDAAAFARHRRVLGQYRWVTDCIRLNARYLEQFLEACETEKVHLFVKDEGSQCQGRPAEPVPGLKSYLYVVMPMRV